VPAPLSGSRAAVLAALERQPEPTTLATLSRTTSLHVNTIREHLEALQSQGQVRRRRAAPSGRGRPAWLYEATRPSHPSGVSEYAALASTLAAAIHRSSPDPRGEGIDAGKAWGQALARGKQEGDVSGAADARQRVVDLLTDLGFAPEPLNRATAVRLTRCPLLDAARSHPDVVCGVHLGIVRGALQEWGTPVHDVELLPFSEPGACRLLMPPTHRSARTRS
jgi:predicted ArsR family transcriptional regulator